MIKPGTARQGGRSSRLTAHAKAPLLRPTGRYMENVT